MKIKVAVIGANGYVGKEILHYCINHQKCQTLLLTSRSLTGKKIIEIFPQYRRKINHKLKFEQFELKKIQQLGIQTVFLALPHGASANTTALLIKNGIKVINLSADFRIKNEKNYQKYYKQNHPQKHLLPDSVYGLSETYQTQIQKTQLCACPGCYPTSILLPLIPLLKEKIIKTKNIFISSMSGVSGAGKKAKTELLFAECSSSIRPYGMPEHRHVAEIEQELSIAAQKTIKINFTPHLVPINRGICTTIYTKPNKIDKITQKIDEIYQKYYKNNKFIRILKNGLLPDTKNVSYSNFIDFSCTYDSRTENLIINSAIDNLGKGAAGQAMQNFNLMHGFNETYSIL